MLIKKVNFGIICLMFLLLSPLTHAESGLCQDLAKFSCSPGRQDDGTGSSTVPTIAEVLKIFDGLNFQKEETENKFRKLLADPQNGELKNLAMSSSGLADSPQCVSKTPASISKCTSDTIEGLMELTKRTLLGQRNFVLNKDGGYGEKYLLSENKQFKDTIGELEKELSKRSARPEVENKIEATIFPRIKELLREKINALPIDEKRKRAMQDKLNTAHYAGSDCDEMAAGLSKDYIPNAFMNPKNGAFKICKGFFSDGTSDFHLAGVIAHELAHIVDPCSVSIGAENIRLSYKNTEDLEKMDQEYPIQGLISCLRSAKSVGAQNSIQKGYLVGNPNGGYSLSPAYMDGGIPSFNNGGVSTSAKFSYCNKTDQIGEVVSDWFSAELVTDYIQEKHPNLSVEQWQIGYSNLYRSACSDSDSNSPTKFDEHPPN